MNVFPYIASNLEIKKRADLSFPYLDYGFLYGYGLFESIRIHNGVPLLLNEHLARLQRGSIILDIPFDFSQSKVEQTMYDLIKKNEVTHCIFNIYLTPGDRSQDPALLSIDNPFLLMVCRPWPEYNHDQRHVLECRKESFQRTPLDRFKTLSWMKNVLERRLSPDVDDVLLFSQSDLVLETTRANVFFVKDDIVVTPKSSSILMGITKQFLLENQKEFDSCILEEPVFTDYLETYDEIFLTNTLKGVFLVDSVRGHKNLKSGPVSEKIQKQYRTLLQLS
jgi:branched-subunit amino acid aminotransferase/4-amino-4-deoxychorismate lyase